jgi:spoIIIJ-associated protein
VAHAEASARTVEAAVTVAAAQLGLRSDQVDIEVLEDPVPSTFGYIGSPARVRVTPRTTTNAPGTSGSGGAGGAGSTDAGSVGLGSAGSGSAGSGSTGSSSVGSGLTDSGSTDSGSTDSGSTDIGSTGARPADQPVPPSSPEAPQVPDPVQPNDPAHAHGLDQTAQPARAASTAPADLTQTPDPTGTPSVTGSAPDPDAGISSAPQASAQVPTTAPAGTAASGPSTAQESESSLAGAPSVPAAQPTPVAAEGDQGPAATATAETGSDGAPSATTEPSIATRPSRRTYRDEPIEPAMVEADTERAGDFLEGLLDALDVDGDITTWVDEVGGHIDLEGPDLDMLVGSNGETLDALQELTRLAVLRQSKRRVRLLLDVNGFRARQRERLVSVARATAEQVIKSQEDHEFQPMTPAERKIVHDAVAAIDGVTTESLGEEPNRRVIIQPT